MKLSLPKGVRPIPPGPHQESVWDYPRPPIVDSRSEHVIVEFGGHVVCETREPLRVLETSHPPTYYLPKADWLPTALRPARGSTYCEWKGHASYLSICAKDCEAEAAAWTYLDPAVAYRELFDHVALYPAAVDRCLVDGEVVLPQPGGFYGGWITSRVVGPFKGGPGSGWW